MKFAIPEISWHNRDPVLSVDFQPKVNSTDPQRLATGGTDSHVLIWYISTSDTGTVHLEVAADLTRHQKAVNVVRWAPNGQLLASGDDESIIFVWRQKDGEPAPVEQGEEQYKETWVIFKTLRGHMEDILDLSWSPSSLHLASGSVDNKLIVWDVTRAKHTSILTDHKGFVQGVAWDPKGQILATASTDRVFRTFDLTTKKVTRSSKTTLPLPSSHPLHNATVRLYHDDTLQTYYRRVQFSPDGLLIAVPGGRIEPDSKADMAPINAVYIYSRHCLNRPVCVLPCGDSALVTRWSPCVYTLRDGPTPALPIAKRMILAVGTKRSVIIYDTQQKTPIAMISNIHYTRLTDLSWSSDGRTLVAASTDGYCSVLGFGRLELGELVPGPRTARAADEVEPMEVDDQQAEQPKENDTKDVTISQKPEPKATTPKIDTFMKFKAPNNEKSESPKNKKSDPKTQKQKTPVKLDVLEETAMQSWSDNSLNDIIQPQEENDKMDIVEIEDSEDMKLVYEDTVNKTSEDMKLVYEDTVNKTSEDMKLVYEDTVNKTSEDMKLVYEDTVNKTSEDMKLVYEDTVNKTSEDMKLVYEDTVNKTSEDMKLVYEDTVNKTDSPGNNTSQDSTQVAKDSKKGVEDSKKADGDSKKDEKEPNKPLHESNRSPESKKLSPKPGTPSSRSNFFSQAKVTDVKEPAVTAAPPAPPAPPAPAAHSPRAPRRVSFVTLSSPKNKKKC